MIDVADGRFQELIDEALGELAGEHVKRLENVAILYAQEPTIEQGQNARLQPGQTLLGLYEGLPLSQRQGTTRLLPDTITLFKGPLTRQSASEAELKQQIKHTLWHEIAHYYGLNHDRIAELE